MKNRCSAPGGRDLPHEPPVTVQIHAPKTAKPDDGLSLSPLKSPLYLLDSLGWLDASGRLRLPASLAHEPFLSSLVGSKAVRHRRC